MGKQPDDLEEDSLEVFRHTPTGTNDPNIVGDVGPFDIPPGSDGHDIEELQLDLTDEVFDEESEEAFDYE